MKGLECVFSVILGAGHGLVAVSIVLSLEHQPLYERSIEQLHRLTQAPDDDELLLLILKCHLVPQVISTVVYDPLVTYILNNQATPGEETPYFLSVETIANQLRDAGHVTEAGSLMMSYRGMHPALRTFDAAMGVLSKWLYRS